MMYLVQNVTTSGLLGSYSNTLLYNSWNRDQRITTQKGATIIDI